MEEGGCVREEHGMMEGVVLMGWEILQEWSVDEGFR